MRAYIKEALFFSENLRPDFQLGRLDLVVRQAGEVARTSRKEGSRSHRRDARRSARRDG